MEKLPGMLGEVSFGDPEKPLPNWRAAPPPGEDDEDEELSPEERQALIGMLGFDPAADETEDMADADSFRCHSEWSDYLRT